MGGGSKHCSSCPSPAAHADRQKEMGNLEYTAILRTAQVQSSRRRDINYLGLSRPIPHCMHCSKASCLGARFSRVYRQAKVKTGLNPHIQPIDWSGYSSSYSLYNNSFRS